MISIIFGNAFSLADKNIILTGISRFFSNNLMGVLEYSGAINYYEAPQYFMSSLNVFVFALLFIEALLSLKKERTKSIMVLFIELLVVYSLFFKLIPLTFNGFVYEAYRYTFVLMPIFALAYAETFDKIFHSKLRYPKSEIIFSTGASFGLLAVSYLLTGSRSDKAIATLLVCIFTAAVISLVSLCYGKTVSRKVCAFCTAIIIAALAFNICFDGFISSTKRVISADINPQSYTGHESDSVEKALKKIKSSDPAFCRIEKTFYSVSWLYADAMIENYPGISAYDSIENKNVQEFVEKVCPEMVFGPFVYYHCFYNVKSNAGINSLLGVKYIFSKSASEYDGSGWLELYDKVDNLYIYKNKHADSIARMYYNAAKQPDDFGKSGIKLLDTLILNDDIKEVSGGRPSEKVASIYNDPHDSSRVYGTVKPEEDGYLFLAVPYSEDWTAYVDSKQVKPLRADYGFIALEITKGNHKVELEYNTPKLTVSTIISICSAILLILFVVFKRILKTLAGKKSKIY